MRRFVEGTDRGQSTLFPECLEDWIGEDNPVRVIDVFVEELDLAGLGFSRVDPEATGRPSWPSFGHDASRAPRELRCPARDPAGDIFFTRLILLRCQPEQRSYRPRKGSVFMVRLPVGPDMH
jgi:hypothetical protein